MYFIIGIGMIIGCYRCVFRRCFDNLFRTSTDSFIIDEVIVSSDIETSSNNNVKQSSIEYQKDNIIKILENNSLLIKKKNVRQEDECIICSEDLKTDNIRLLNCFHKYHDKFQEQIFYMLMTK